MSSFHNYKKLTGIIALVKAEPFRKLFQKFNVLLPASKYIFCLLSFVVENLKNLTEKQM
jgi:hypothetical protein